MAGMTEGCSVCGRHFDVQFRYQMEEKNGGFAFYCSQECHGKSLRGEDKGGVVCDACKKHFALELVSQVVKVAGVRRYACGETCKTQLLAEAGGVRLGALLAPTGAMDPVVHPSQIDRSVAPSLPVSMVGAIAKPAPVPAQPSVPPAAPIPGADPTTAKSVPSVPAVPFVPSATSVPSPPVTAIRREKAKIHGPRRLAIFNHKGGTGKTTTTVSIAAGLAARGLKVLLVDTDSQGNVGVSFGHKIEKSLYHVLVMGLRAKDAAIEVRPNLDLIASNETLAAAELYLAGRQNRDRILKDRLAAVSEDYDIVIIDCSPSLSLMNQNALVFADGILVPVACDFLSLVGVRQVIKTVKNVNALLHHPVQIFGVLPTFYDARARICRDAVETLKEHFGDRCLPPIRQTTRIKEAPAQGRTIFEYAPESNAAEDYQRIVDFIVDGKGVLAGAPGDDTDFETDSQDGPRAATA
ncbi:MAG: AAA family ATPase [Polyangiaceae bacterium]